MATIKGYVQNLWDAQQWMARQLGSDIRVISAEARVIILAQDLTTAVILKTLVDKGVVTDAELVTTMTAVRNAIYARQPPEVIPPEDGSDIPPPTL
jgi:hypothetical protein